SSVFDYNIRQSVSSFCTDINNTTIIPVMSGVSTNISKILISPLYQGDNVSFDNWNKCIIKTGSDIRDYTASNPNIIIPNITYFNNSIFSSYLNSDTNTQIINIFNLVNSTNTSL